MGLSGDEKVSSRTDVDAADVLRVSREERMSPGLTKMSDDHRGAQGVKHEVSAVPFLLAALKTVRNRTYDDRLTDKELLV